MTTDLDNAIAAARSERGAQSVKPEYKYILAASAVPGRSDHLLDAAIEAMEGNE